MFAATPFVAHDAGIDRLPLTRSMPEHAKTMKEPRGLDRLGYVNEVGCRLDARITLDGRVGLAPLEPGAGSTQPHARHYLAVSGGRA